MSRGMHPRVWKSCMNYRGTWYQHIVYVGTEGNTFMKISKLRRKQFHLHACLCGYGLLLIYSHVCLPDLVPKNQIQNQYWSPPGTTTSMTIHNFPKGHVQQIWGRVFVPNKKPLRGGAWSLKGWKTQQKFQNFDIRRYRVIFRLIFNNCMHSIQQIQQTIGPNPVR